MQTNNEHIRQVLKLVRNMIIIADEGQAAAEDDGCRVLYGIVQDCAYRIRQEAERERAVHQRTGKWEDDGVRPSIPAGAER